MHTDIFMRTAVIFTGFFLALLLAVPVVQAQPSADPQRSARVIEEIIVTSRKREESIQDAPLSVTPFSMAQIEQRGFRGLEDIAASTPGFTYEGFITAGHNGNAVIRGLAQQFTTSRIQNVSFFIDGVYLQRQSMLNLSMIDMERIEVMKGPQNAVYGRNAFSGAINYITQKPVAQPEAYVSATLGSDDRQDFRVSFGGPLAFDGRLMGKFTYGYTEYDGHTENNHPVSNANPSGDNTRGRLGGWEDEVISVALAFEPTDNIAARMSYYRTDIVRETQPGYSISGVNAARFSMRRNDQNDLNCNEVTVANIGDPSQSHTGFSAFCGELPNSAHKVAHRSQPGIVIDPRGIGAIAETDVVTFNLDWVLTNTLSAHYLFGFAKHNSESTGGPGGEDPLEGRRIVTNAFITTADPDNPEGYTFVNTFSGRPNVELRGFSHELRFDWDISHRLRSSFGAYYSSIRDRDWTELYLSALCNADSEENIRNCNQPLSTPSPIPDEAVLTSAVVLDQGARQHGGARGEFTSYDDRIYSVFGSLGMDFTERFRGSFEFRYTQEDKKVKRLTDAFALAPGQTVTYDPFPVGQALFFGPGSNSLTSMIVVPEDSATFRNFTPRAILEYSLTMDSLLYASVARGVKTGGFNNAEDVGHLTYDQETNMTYELGSKNTLFDRRLVLNASLFLIQLSDLQGGVPPAQGGLSSSDVIANIGDITSYGIELESTLLLTDKLSLDVGFTYNDASYDDGVIYSPAINSFRCDGITCPADGEVGGNQVARTSKVQGSIGINYTALMMDWLVSSRVDANYQSKQFLTPLNLGWVPERTITNASANFLSPGEHWELNLWGKNLTDERYAASAFVIGVFNQYMVGLGAGRSFGATLKYNFF